MRDSLSIWVALALLVLQVGCEPDRRQLVIAVDDSISEQVISFEVYVVRPAVGPTTSELDASPDAETSADASPDAAPDDATRPRTCRDLLARTSDIEFPEALMSVRLAPGETTRLGPFGEGQLLVLVRGRDASCRLAQGCQEVEIEPGNEAQIRVELTDF